MNFASWMWLVMWVGVPSGALWAESGQGSTVTVSIGETSGPLSPMFRAGMFLNEYPLDHSFQTFFSELKPGLIHVMPLKDAFNVESLTEYVRQLPSLPATKWAMEAHARGGEVIIGLTEIPRWLRQGDHRDAYLRPPRDMNGWSEFVEANVHFFNGILKLNAMFVLWDEPDSPMFWKNATEQDYFALYRAFVIGARRGDAAAKVGGPATSWWGAKGPGSDGKQAMLKNFIDYCAKTSAKEVGLQKLPLDFIVWHQFNTDPKGDPLLYTVPIGYVREWLKQGGYNSATPLINGSWNSWMNFGRDPNELSSERDQPFDAAYAVHAVVAMEQAGFSQHNFFNLFENWQWKSLAQGRRNNEFKGRELFGGFGLLSRNGIVKPVFNAFKAMSMLEGSRIRVTTNDPYLSVVASKTEDTVYLLVADFHWPAESLMALKGRTLLANGYPPQELAELAKVLTPAVVKEVEGGKRSIKSLTISDGAKKELESLAYLDKFYRERESQKSVHIALDGVLPGTGDVSVDLYTVDDEHGNATRATASLAAVQTTAIGQIQVRVGDQLVQWGRLNGEFGKWDKPRQAREIQAVVQKLSGEERRTVEGLVQRTAGETLATLNRSAEVGLAKQSLTTVSRTTIPITFDALVKPYSVNLFVLHGK
ncbi:MAG: hypothetical protein WBK08_01075 [Nitrospira sp.]